MFKVTHAWQPKSGKERGRSRMARDDDDDNYPEILGQHDPGFFLWTSAHGFGHIARTYNTCWRIAWIVIVLICTGCLIGCIIYYFWYVFKISVFSRVVIESAAANSPWPTTIVCEKQAFQLNKLQNVTTLSNAAATLLTWSLGPNLAQPAVFNYNSVNMQNAKANLDSVMVRTRYNGNFDLLVRDLAPTCTQLILYCTVGNTGYAGSDCCGKIFNSTPIINQYGTCFTTVGASESMYITGAGETNGLQVLTMHEDATTFDSEIASPNLIDARGVSFAVVDQFTSVETAMRTQGQSAALGTVSNVGLTRYVVDSSELEKSLIGRKQCTATGTRDTTKVDSDFLIGLGNNYGYTKDNCLSSKIELLSQNVMNCTYNPASTTSVGRCSPLKSVVLYRSFLDSNNTGTTLLKTVSMSTDMQTRYAKECPQDCIVDRYTMSTSTSQLSDDLKSEFASQFQLSSTVDINVAVVKFYFNSLEYQHVYNFPQNGLQFLAEVGGLMSFFLGISVISLFECICYVGFGICSCCRCRRPFEVDAANEELPPPKFNKQTNRNDGGAGRRNYY